MKIKNQSPPTDISQHIKRMRGNLSQTEFARRVGIRRSLISSYESGEILPSLASLEKLATYARVSIDYLLGIEDAPSHKLTAEEEEFVYQLHKLPPEPKPLSLLNILLYSSLIIGLIVYMKYLGI